MAKSETKIIKEITLVLTEKEAEYLKCITQNCFHYVSREDEPIEESSMRAEIFNILKEALMYV